jgi:hypothetical protein
MAISDGVSCETVDSKDVYVEVEGCIALEAVTRQRLVKAEQIEKAECVNWP